MNSKAHNPPDAVAQLRHDLRTPVNHIIGYSEMLLEDAEEDANESSAADLKKIRSAAQELLEVINTRLVAGEVGETLKSADA
ncbi:MAG: histidine kinase dimerization/phospho-acceptor domain-containing protein, partial [Spartobacteria bacterium]